MALDAYKRGVDENLSALQIQANMATVIEQYSSEFHHLPRGTRLSVFDVAPSSVGGGDRNVQARLVRETTADRRVVRFFQPPDDPGFHYEIPNP